MCGEVKSKEKEKTSSMPLVTVSDLQRLPKWTMIVLRLRMMPFKTKMKPNWQMEKENLWEKSYAKATYPTREKQKIELFDIKTFVQQKKEEKINEMMNGNGPMPFMPTQRGASPFTPPLFNKKEQNNSFDVDDLVKRIDAKIAELEAEEAREKEEQMKEENIKPEISEIKEEIIEDVKDDFDLTTQEIKKEEKHKITDDQFFDDFFNDDE